MMVEKWNKRLIKYEPYELPVKAKLFSQDMDEVIACARCGKDMRFGDGYTSKQIHSPIGLGYSVCENCYGLELKEDGKQG